MLDYTPNYNTKIVLRDVQGFTSSSGAAIYASLYGDHRAGVRFGRRNGDPCEQGVNAQDCHDLAEFFTRLADELDAS